MLKNIIKSLAFRLPSVYQKLLWREIKLSINKPALKEVILLSMTGKTHLNFLKYSIWSIAHNWSKLPLLYIYNDGSLNNEKIKTKITFWGNDLHIDNWEICKKHHVELKRPALINYANVDPFGKKLALILYHASISPTIWVDNDILFYKDFVSLIPQHSKETETCGGCEDWMNAYHKEIVKFYPILSKFENFNAGLLYIHGKDFYERYHLEEILNKIHPQYDFFTEQSIFAKFASESLGKVWSKKVILNFNSDKQEIAPMNIKNSIARHYTSNIRHLFWRDLFFYFNKI